jgi:signal transduction histidine kinase
MRWATRLPLVAAFGAVVLSFLAATVYSERRLVEIDESVRHIESTGLPGIEALTSARTSMRKISAEAREVVDAATEGRKVRRSFIPAARVELERDLDLYHGLPVAHREPDRDRAIRAGMVEVDAAYARVIDRVQAGDLSGANSRLLYDLDPAIALVDEEFLRRIAIDVGNLHELATTIGSSRRRSTMFAFLLDGASVLLALVTGWLAFRALGQYMKRERERADELEMFAGRVAHDVLGPLTTVRMAFDLSRQRAEGKLRSMLDRADASLERVRQIVDTLLAFARAGAHPDPDARADVPEVLASVVDELRGPAQAASIELRVDASTEHVVSCSPGALYSIVSNLVNNAIKYMGDAPIRRITARTLTRGACMRCEVEDTGPGVPPHLERSVFEPYVRAHGATQPGIGLGLATVRRIVVAHGGSVGLRSQPGRGACFWFELPLAEARFEPAGKLV